MKVALIHIRYIYKGGLETRLFNYIDFFLKRGDEVHLFTSKKAPEIIPPDNLKVHLINVRKYPKPFRNFFFDKKLKRKITRENYDFILSLERTTRQYHVIAPSSHKGYLKAQNKFLSDPIDWMQIYLDKNAFSNAKVVYACSTMVKDEIVKYYAIESEKIKVLFPPTNTEKFNIEISKTEARDKWKLKDDKIYFLLVSTSHKRKGLNVLLEVFRELNSEKYILLVAGSNFESPFENVKSLGFVKDMSSLYRAVNFTVHPAIYEPFGQIVVESLACETPVVVSSNVGAKELINEDIGEVVEGLDIDIWKEKLIEVATKSYFKSKDSFKINNLSLDTHMKKMLEWSVINKKFK